MSCCVFYFFWKPGPPRQEVLLGVLDVISQEEEASDTTGTPATAAKRSGKEKHHSPTEGSSLRTVTHVTRWSWAWFSGQAWNRPIRRGTPKRLFLFCPFDTQIKEQKSHISSLFLSLLICTPFLFHLSQT